MINRTYHWSLMQTEKYQPEGKRIMPETRFTEVFFGLHRRPMIDFYSYLLLENDSQLRPLSEFALCLSNVKLCKQLTSL